MSFGNSAKPAGTCGDPAHSFAAVRRLQFEPARSCLRRVFLRTLPYRPLAAAGLSWDAGGLHVEDAARRRGALLPRSHPGRGGGLLEAGDGEAMDEAEAFFAELTGMPRPVRRAFGLSEDAAEAAPGPIDAVVMWTRGKAYFFYGPDYVRYDVAGDKVDPGYPKPIKGNWPGLFEKDIDAAIEWGNGKPYFFKGDQYSRYDMTADKVDPGFPKKIKGNWPGLFEKDIDAAVNWGNGKAYFFKGTSTSATTSPPAPPTPAFRRRSPATGRASSPATSTTR